MKSESLFNSLHEKLNGEVKTDRLHKIMYATDASVYREIPLGVAYPKNEEDLVNIVNWATKNQTPLIPRAGGTSLAGQVVGDGLVVDVSRHLNKILDIDVYDKWIKVQPGVILSQLNDYLRSKGLHFGPNTSTHDRCTIGGMVGNNSSGSGSIKYGTTRDKILHIRSILSDGSIADFYGIENDSFTKKKDGPTLENGIYRQVDTLLRPKDIREEMLNNYPHLSIHRRNTGYALDSLIQTDPFINNNSPLNIAKLLCGSEGTLCLFSEITLQLDDLPPPHSFLYIPHFSSFDEALKSVESAMKIGPYKCELADKKIIACTRQHPTYSKLASFINGMPEVILIIEYRANSINELNTIQSAVLKEFQRYSSIYDHTILPGHQSEKVWEMRAAGLGLLSNLPGKRKGVACVEDGAVRIKDLSDYIREFNLILKKYNQESVYYAHAGAGELHLRPILDLTDSKDTHDFRNITQETAVLLKKFKGSLSGEHGDGRVRSEFIELMYGKKIYSLFESIKKAWDPNNIFNPGKIVHPVQMDVAFRDKTIQASPHIEQAFSLESDEDVFSMASQCNGSGDCRKINTGTMCPTYMATRDEKDTTRARANMLREVCSQGKDIFEDPDLDEILQTCIGCKACKSECPSQVDMAMLKSEYYHQKNKAIGLNKIDRYYATMDTYYSKAYLFGKLSWKIATLGFFEKKARASMQIHTRRSIPKLAFPSLYHWWTHEGRKMNPLSNKKEVLIFCDEFTNYFEPHIGVAAIRLLQKLNYFVVIPKINTSARAAISKGFLDIAKKESSALINIFSSTTYKQRPIIGIEPSAILGFRDEYPKLHKGQMLSKANELKNRTFLFEEFIYNEYKSGRIHENVFSSESRNIHVHTHCHQKALSDENIVNLCLSIPKNYTVNKIPSGCCGMAGSFGYEKKYYNLSQKIANLVLYPYLKNIDNKDIVVATGTSCRHQLKDGLNGLKCFHPAEVLYNALN